MRASPVALRPFDDTSANSGTSLRADVTREGTLLTLRWILDTPPGSLVLPAESASSTRRDHLWESTCFEAFLAPAGRPEYWEVNLSPSGDWNVYRFDGERQGMRPEPRVGRPSIAMITDPAAASRVTAALDLASVAELAASTARRRRHRGAPDHRRSPHLLGGAPYPRAAGLPRPRELRGPAAVARARCTAVEMRRRDRLATRLSTSRARA